MMMMMIHEWPRVTTCCAADAGSRHVLAVPFALRDMAAGTSVAASSMVASTASLLGSQAAAAGGDAAGAAAPAVSPCWKPSAASCTLRMALPEISCRPAQLGSQEMASGVEHAMLKPCTMLQMSGCSRHEAHAVDRVLHRRMILTVAEKEAVEMMHNNDLCMSLLHACSGDGVCVVRADFKPGK